ncbi:MAG TPA: energy transducer TonB [Methylotenera sp.]|nr:energy transducer TonB [Methylotenera sp.]
MTTAITQSSTNENRLIWAIICSILLHVLLAVGIPSIKIDPPKKPEVLEVALVSKPEPPTISEPEPLPQPEQPQPEPVKPKTEPKPIVKPTPATSVIKEEPSPVTPPPQQTEVIAVTPKPEAPPSPAPVVPKLIVPTQVEVDTAHKGYGDTLWSTISKHKKYPRIAQTRGWQGEVIVELSLDGNGNLKSKRIIQHSGYDSLDQQALEMVDKAMPFPAPPEALRGSSFTIKVPIPFRLEEQ